MNGVYNPKVGLNGQEELVTEVWTGAKYNIDSLVTRGLSGWFCDVRAVRREGFGCSGWGLCCGR